MAYIPFNQTKKTTTTSPSGYIPFNKKPASAGMQNWNGIEIPLNIKTKNLIAYDPQTKVSTFKFPDSLGGGTYSQDVNNNIVKTPRGYGETETVSGSQRDHIVPVSLGGGSTKENIQIQGGYKAGGLADKSDKAEMEVLQRLKDGKITEKSAINEILRIKYDLGLKKPSIVEIVKEATKKVADTVMQAHTETNIGKLKFGASQIEPFTVPSTGSFWKDAVNVVPALVLGLTKVAVNPLLTVAETMKPIDRETGFSGGIPLVGGVKSEFSGRQANYDKCIQSGGSGKQCFLEDAFGTGIDMAILVSIARGFAGKVLSKTNPEVLLQTKPISKEILVKILNGEEGIDADLLKAFKKLPVEQRVLIAKRLLTDIKVAKPSVIGQVFKISKEEAQTIFDQLTTAKVPEAVAPKLITTPTKPSPQAKITPPEAISGEKGITAQEAVSKGISKEEWIKGQVNAFHGTTEKELKLDTNKPVFLTNDFDSANTYAGYSYNTKPTGKVLSFYAKEGKTLDLNKVENIKKAFQDIKGSPELKKAYNSIPEKYNYLDDYGDIGTLYPKSSASDFEDWMMMEYQSKPKIGESGLKVRTGSYSFEKETQTIRKNLQEAFNTYGKPTRQSVYNNWDSLIKYAKEKGYDYIDHTTESPDASILFPEKVALNPKKTLLTPSQLSSLYDEAVKEAGVKEKIAPAKGIAELPTKPSGIAKSIEAKAIEAGLIKKGYSELAGFDSSTFELETKKTADLINSGIDNARAVVRGEKPTDIKAGALISGMEEYAKQNPALAGEIMEELANSPLATEISEGASETSFARMRDPDSATAKLQGLKKWKEEKVAKSTKRTSKDVAKKLKEGTKETNLSKEELSWNKFLDDITC